MDANKPYAFRFVNGGEPTQTVCFFEEMDLADMLRSSEWKHEPQLSKKALPGEIPQKWVKVRGRPPKQVKQ